MAEIKIRFARKEDIPAIVELWNEMVDFGTGLEFYLQMAEENIMDYSGLPGEMELNPGFAYPTSAFYKSNGNFTTFMEIMAMEL